MNRPQGCSGTALACFPRLNHTCFGLNTHIRTPGSQMCGKYCGGNLYFLYTHTTSPHTTLLLILYTDTAMLLPILTWLLRMPASDAFLHHAPASALTCSSAARFGSYSNEAPQITCFACPITSSSSSPQSSIFSTTYLSSLLPLDPTAPALYTGMSQHWRRGRDGHPCRYMVVVCTHLRSLCPDPWLMMGVNLPPPAPMHLVSLPPPHPLSLFASTECSPDFQYFICPSSFRSVFPFLRS